MVDTEDANPGQSFIMVVPLIDLLDSCQGSDLDYANRNRYTVVRNGSGRIPTVAGDMLQMFYNFIQGKPALGGARVRGEERTLKPETVSCILFYVRDRDCEAPPSCLMWTDARTMVPSVRITYEAALRLQRYQGSKRQLRDTLTPNIYFSADGTARDQLGRSAINRCDIEVGYDRGGTGRNHSTRVQKTAPKSLKADELAKKANNTFMLNDEMLTDEVLKEQVDFVAAPFERSKSDFFVGFSVGMLARLESNVPKSEHDPAIVKQFERILWSSRRQELCVEALQRLNIRTMQKSTSTSKEEENLYVREVHMLLPPNRVDKEAGIATNKRCNLQYLLDHEVFDDVFVPHDRDAFVDGARQELNQELRNKALEAKNEDALPSRTFVRICHYDELSKRAHISIT